MTRQTAVDLGPTIAIICRAKDSTRGSRKNMPAGVDGQRKNFKIRQTGIDCGPTAAIIRRTKDSTTICPRKKYVHWS
jgi:hypothetical protein